MSLYTEVLILNKHFLAIKVGIAKDAICALYTGKAEVVDEQWSVRNLQKWIPGPPNKKNVEMEPFRAM